MKSKERVKIDTEFYFNDIMSSRIITIYSKSNNSYECGCY